MDIHSEADYKRALTQLTVLVGNDPTNLERILALRDNCRTYRRA
ncbi:antitoxin component HigA of HigAB toxin-antitoxin module [Hymenobacter sp. UYAg731]